MIKIIFAGKLNYLKKINDSYSIVKINKIIFLNIDFDVGIDKKIINN